MNKLHQIVDFAHSVNYRCRKTGVIAPPGAISLRVHPMDWIDIVKDAHEYSGVYNLTNSHIFTPPVVGVICGLPVEENEEQARGAVFVHIEQWVMLEYGPRLEGILDDAFRFEGE